MGVFGGPNRLNAVLARLRSRTSAGGVIAVEDVENVIWPICVWPICGDTIAKERARMEDKR